LSEGINNQKLSSEYNLVESLQLMDAGLKLYDSSLNSELGDEFPLFMDAYNKSNGSPDKIDLVALKKQMNDKIDLYIINSSDAIEFATYTPELNLDFRKIAPEFASYLDNIRGTQGFFPDRISSEVLSGNLRKFGYMPTPDHKYILELGLIPEKFIPDRSRFAKNNSKIIDDIKLLNPYIRDIELFNIFGNKVEGQSQMNVSDPSISQKVITFSHDKKITEEISPDGQKLFKYLYIDLSDEKVGSDASEVAVITYDVAKIKKIQNEHFFLYLIICILAILFSVGIVLYVTKRVVKPINTIVNDITQISNGDLDHYISQTNSYEFHQLSKSINNMVSHFKKNIEKLEEQKEKLKKSEEQILSMNIELESRVKKRTEELETMNSELESFSYSISHDLRAPIRVIDGFARIIEEDYKECLKEDGLHSLMRIFENVKRMEILIDNILQFSRIGRYELKRETVNLNQVVEDKVELLSNQYPDIRSIVTIEELPPCYGDPLLIGQVIENLLSNALKFSNKVEKPKVIIGSTQKNGLPVYFVKDNGAGFDMANVKKLFLVFSRLHSQDDFTGTGVGLAIVKRIISRHGGLVWAESVINEGATFFFTIKHREKNN